MTRIFFPYLAPKEMASFVRTDFELLKKRYEVIPYFYTAKLRSHWDEMRIAAGMMKADLGYTKFAYTQAYYIVRYARLFKKKSIVLLGGFDVTEEEWQGRKFAPGHLRRLRYTLDNATCVIANSKQLKELARKYTKRRDVKLIYDGFNTKKFKSEGKKEDIVLTVSYIRKDNLWRKGLETFVKTAEYLPDARFVLVGKPLDSSIKHLKSISSENVSFPGFVSDPELIKYMQKAKVYAQLSAHEGFGCALAEAMLCECVPVATDRGAIPEVVGDTGYYVPYDDSKATAEAIKKALADNEKGKLARERIKTMFSVEKRRRRLIALIETLVSEGKYQMVRGEA